MKKNIAFIVFALCLTACAQSAKGPNGVEYRTVVQYNDYIVDRQTYILKSMKQAVAEISENKNVALNMLTNVAAQCMKTASEVEGMPAWKGNTNFRDKAVGMFKYYGTTYANEFKELIQTAANPETTEADRAGLVGKGEAIDREETKMNDGFIKAQKEFSEANDLKLETKELQ